MSAIQNQPILEALSHSLIFSKATAALFQALSIAEQFNPPAYVGNIIVDGASFGSCPVANNPCAGQFIPQAPVELVPEGCLGSSFLAGYAHSTTFSSVAEVLLTKAPENSFAEVLGARIVVNRELELFGPAVYVFHVSGMVVRMLNDQWEGGITVRAMETKTRNPFRRNNRSSRYAKDHF